MNHEKRNENLEENGFRDLLRGQKLEKMSPKKMYKQARSKGIVWKEIRVR